MRVSRASRANLQVAKKKSKLRKTASQAKVSEVTSFADTNSNKNMDKMKLFIHIWCVKLGLSLEEDVNIEKFFDALKSVNKDLVSDDMVAFCMCALDIVRDASQHAVPYSFKMFTTIASLCDRVVSMSLAKSILGFLLFAFCFISLNEMEKDKSQVFALLFFLAGFLNALTCVSIWHS